MATPNVSLGSREAVVRAIQGFGIVAVIRMRDPAKLRAVVDALADIGFDKWAQLECDAPSGSIEADMTKNLQFIPTADGSIAPGIKYNASSDRRSWAAMRAFLEECFA